jgi:hypothetical protein
MVSDGGHDSHPTAPLTVGLWFVTLPTLNVVPNKVKSGPSLPATVREQPVNDLERRRALGQFFTSLPVATFIWNLLEVIRHGPFPPATRVIDPACGEGVFLRVAREQGGLPAATLFGSDIDETLVAGWRDDPLLRGARETVCSTTRNKASAKARSMRWWATRPSAARGSATCCACSNNHRAPSTKNSICLDRRA